MEDELLKLKGDHKIPTKVLFKRTLQYVKPEIWHFILAILLIICNVITSIVSPILMQNLVDNIKSDNISLKIILGVAFGYLGLTIVSQSFLYFQSMVLQKVGQRIIYKLRLEVFTHVENMSINQINEMPVGSLVTRVANYTASMSNFFTDTITSLFKCVLTVILVYALMCYYSWKLSLVMLAIVIVLFVFTFIFRKFIGKGFRNERNAVSELNTFLNENLSGMKIIQLFSQEERKKEEFTVKNENLRKRRVYITLLFSIFRPFTAFMYIVSIAITFYMGLELKLTSGEIVAFYLCISSFFNPIQTLADQLNNIQSATSASEKLFSLMDVKPDVLDKPHAIDVDTFKGKIEFRNVWFAYEKENWILKNVSFVVNPGETAAFVGATGAGKTTILQLIVRNYEPQKGQILIDDIDISTMKIESLRSKIGQMLQDVFLFTGTIKSNITLRDDFNDDEVMKVCEYVNADRFIRKLDKGLNNEVIQGGENLSQGERQLLSFARTIIHKPQILILDEATANIDTETEKLIQNSLEKMREIGTMLVVAHRLSTIENSDQIFCLKNGEIIERGTHKELIKLKGYYYNLHQIQTVAGEDK